MQHFLGQVREPQVGAVPRIYGAPRLSFAGAETSKQAHVVEEGLETRRRGGDLFRRCSSALQ